MLPPPLLKITGQVDTISASCEFNTIREAVLKFSVCFFILCCAILYLNRIMSGHYLFRVQGRHWILVKQYEKFIDRLSESTLHPTF